MLSRRGRSVRVLTYASLLLSAATAILWIRRYWVSDAVAYLGRSGQYGALAGPGILVIGRSNTGTTSPEWRFDHFPGRLAILEYLLRQRGGRPSIPNRLGFGFHVVQFPSSAYSSSAYSGSPTVVLQPGVVNEVVYSPLWAVFVTFLILPGLQLYRRLRAPGANPFACGTCGYDLRATPDRCPECGHEPEAAVARQ